MQCRSNIRRFLAASAVFLLIASLATASAQNRRGRKYKAPPPTSKIEVTVVRDDDSKPIENASIIFHPIVDGKDQGNMELKSDEDGKTTLDVIPIGDTVRLQIIAKGYQTYGQDYKVEKNQMALEIRMKRPGAQYSIYKDHAGDKKDPNPKPQQ